MGEVRFTGAFVFQVTVQFLEIYGVCVLLFHRGVGYDGFVRYVFVFKSNSFMYLGLRGGSADRESRGRSGFRLEVRDIT